VGKPSSSYEILPPRPTAREASRRDRIGLRAMAQDAVHEFTSLRRDELYRQHVEEHGVPPTPDWLDRMQPLVEEFDPVVELSIIAIDRRNDVAVRRQALSDAAQYLRPKLSAVALLDDPDTLAAEASKHELAKRLVGAMELFARAKSVNPGPPPPTTSTYDPGDDD
jgi:hypothetical protein